MAWILSAMLSTYIGIIWYILIIYHSLSLSFVNTWSLDSAFLHLHFSINSLNSLLELLVHSSLS